MIVHAICDHPRVLFVTSLQTLFNWFVLFVNRIVGLRLNFNTNRSKLSTCIKHYQSIHFFGGGEPLGAFLNRAAPGVCAWRPGSNQTLHEKLPPGASAAAEVGLANQDSAGFLKPLTVHLVTQILDNFGNFEPLSTFALNFGAFSWRTNPKAEFPFENIDLNYSIWTNCLGATFFLFTLNRCRISSSWLPGGRVRADTPLEGRWGTGTYWLEVSLGFNMVQRLHQSQNLNRELKDCHFCVSRNGRNQYVKIAILVGKRISKPWGVPCLLLPYHFQTNPYHIVGDCWLICII